MTLEIKEQELLSRRDSRLVLKGIDGIWEPDIHTLRINLRNSDLEVDERTKDIIFPLKIYYTLDNSLGRSENPVFVLNLESNESGISWNTDEINIILDLTLPDYVVADIVPERDTADLHYLESTGKTISSNFLDLISETLTDEQISKFADKESWYRYIRISSDRSFTSGQYIDKDGKIISQEYIYYKYSGLKVFFDGGKTRIFNLSPDTLYLKLSGYADREEYYVKGDLEPVLLGKTVVHIKEVPGLEINPRSREEDAFIGRFNYSSFNLFVGRDENSNPFILNNPRSFNFVSYQSGQPQYSNNIVIGAGEPVNDIWEFLEATTDLETFRDSDGTPMFFLQGETMISFVAWNAFREKVVYTKDNIILTSSDDLASHFTFDVHSWDKKQWTNGEIQRDGVLEITLKSDGSDNLNGILTFIDTEDETEVVSIIVRTLSDKSTTSLFITDENGNTCEEFCITPETASGTLYFDIFGASLEAEKVQAKLLKVYDLDCGLVSNQSRQAWIDSEGGEKQEVVRSKHATLLGGDEEINISRYLSQDIILFYDKTYKIKAPEGGFHIETHDSFFTVDELGNGTLEVPSGVGVTGRYKINYYLNNQTSVISETGVYFVETPSNTFSLDYNGFSNQEDSKYLFGYFLLGFDLENLKSVLNYSKLVPVYIMPNVKFGCTTETMYDRAISSGQEDRFADIPEVANAASQAYSNIGSDRNLILGKGKTWVTLNLPSGYYIDSNNNPIYKSYKISSPSSSDSYYISIDQDKWTEMTGGKDYIISNPSYTGENTWTHYGVKIPIEIKNLPTDSRIVSVDISVKVGDYDSSKVITTFYLYQEVLAIKSRDVLPGGNTVIYETPTNLFTPKKVTRSIGLRDGNRGSSGYYVGPAFNSSNYSAYEVMNTNIMSVAKLDYESVGLYNGNLNRSNDSFSWASGKEDGGIIAIDEVSVENEYNSSNYYSLYIPEYREYEVSYKLSKRDDFFPQYPVSKVSFKVDNRTSDYNIYLFYMPANPYVMAKASKKHYIHITPEQRAAWEAYKANPESVTKPDLIQGSFELRSNYFDVSEMGLSEVFDINAEEGETGMSTRTARYLMHPLGWVGGVSIGDVYAEDKAFKEFTAVSTNSSVDYEDAVLVSYKFDPSCWRGEEETLNYVAELFFRQGGDDYNSHRDVFPGNLSSIIGHDLDWSYSDNVVWEERYDYGDDPFYVPGDQRQYDPEPFIRLEANVGHASSWWEKIAYIPFRCQIRTTADPISTEADLSISAYGSTYPWELLGHFTSGDIVINPYPENESDRVAYIDNITYSSDNSRTTAKVVINPNSNRIGFSRTTKIEDNHYKVRECHLHTLETNQQYLNIEQQPSEGYIVFSSEKTNELIYSASQNPIYEEPLISESYLVNKEGGAINLYFEYLETLGIETYMEDEDTPENATFADYIGYDERARLDWRGSNENPSYLIAEKEGDLEFGFQTIYDNVDDILGNMGKIFITVYSNDTDSSRAGRLKISRRDNGAVILDITITQAGNSVLSYSSGAINSAGSGRLMISSEYDINTLSFDGPSECYYLGYDDTYNKWVYKLSYPENRLPIARTRVINVSCSEIPNKTYTISLSQGYYAAQVKKEGERWSNGYNLDGTYIFDGNNDLNSKFFFRFVYSEPDEGGVINDALSDERALRFYIDKLNVKSVKYQIVSPSEVEYEVSQVFSTLSTDIVYDGSVTLEGEETYPYIHTVGNVFEYMKELNLILVAEVTLGTNYEASLGYSYHIDFNTYPTEIKDIQNLEATNKIQIWYKI